MKKTTQILALLALIAASTLAYADPWKDESGHGRHGKHGGREVKEEFWDGNCKVERKYNKHGDFKEERSCKAPRRKQRYYQPVVTERVYVEEPQYRYEAPRRDSGVNVDIQIGL